PRAAAGGIGSVRCSAIAITLRSIIELYSDRMFEYPSRKVAVIVEREAVESRWLTHRWELVGAVADVGGEARVIHEAPSHLQRLHPGFEVFLYPEEAEGYYL